MKVVRYMICFALAAFLLSSCTYELEEHDPGPQIPGLDVYRINISFKDPAGRDLLEQFAYYRSDPTNPKYLGEVDPDKYNLRIVSSFNYSQEYYKFTMAKFDELHSWMKTDKNGVYPNRGTWYFSNDFVIMTKNNGSPYSPLKYQINCLDLFGANYHEIVTWWEEGTVDKETGQHFPKCVKATFNGKEVKVVQGITFNEKAEPYYVGYFLDIVISGSLYR